MKFRKIFQDDRTFETRITRIVTNLLKMESIGPGQLMRILAICVVASDKFLIFEEKPFETNSDDNRLPGTPSGHFLERLRLSCAAVAGIRTRLRPL